MGSEPWIDHAACASIGTASFYPEPGESWAEAIAICRFRCSVRLLCLDYAMRSEEGRPAKHRFGVLGGLKPQQRRRYEPEWLAEQEGDVA